MKEILNYIQLYTGCNDHALKRIEAMLEPRLITKVITKTEVVEKILTRNLRPKITLESWSKFYYNSNKTSYEIIANKSRVQTLVNKRNAYIKAAYLAGYRPTEIANYLDRNHSTILHAIGK